jgi:hypothetical protein
VLGEAIAASATVADERTLELQGTCFAAAHDDTAATAARRAAAERSGRGELYLRVAERHLRGAAWEPASRMLLRALERGGLRDESRARLLLGALASQGRSADARTWLLRARESRSTAAEAASWLGHLAARQQARASP